MSIESERRALPGGLVLRPAQPADLEQIGQLLIDRGDPGDALDHRLVVQDVGWDGCVVVADGDRVVSTTTLLNEVLQLDDVDIPAGQVDMVATLPAYEGRGLVRASMAWAHRRSEARGHLMQVMIGIPYFYRLFGYSYSIGIAPRRPVLTELPPISAGEHALQVRPATAADIDGLSTLNDVVQRGSTLRMGHTPECWRWVIAQEATDTVVVQDAACRLVGSARMSPPDDEVLVAEVTAQTSDAAWTLLRHGHERAREELKVAERPGVAGETWAPVLDPAASDNQMYYTRIPDVRRLLDHLRPVFERRLAAADLPLSTIPDQRFIISTFHEHYLLPVDGDHLGLVKSGGPMQSPGVHGAVAIAPDVLGAALFGSRGLDGLASIHPDVYVARNADLMRVLFPPVSSDLMTYYLP